MSVSHGRFVWCELLATDVASATAFYQSVIGWTAKEAGMPGGHYTILSTGEIAVAGLMALPQAARDSGAQPGWIGYVAVDDVDLFASRVQDAGGTIHRPAEDIPGVGRFAIVTDPQGAPITLFKPSDAVQSPQALAGAPGHVGWHELRAADWETVFPFYNGLFGWTKADAIDMGPMGTYQLFAIAGTVAGGMMTRTEATSGPSWLYYFNVEHIDAAVARVKDAGGELVQGPQQVPGGSWIVHCLDEQGVMFAMVGAEH